MGRVKRYKKIKACDPFSKRQTKEVDTIHDQPPDLHEAREKRKKRKHSEFDEFNRAELLHDAQHIQNKPPKEERKIAPKQANESMKTFLNRIRNETRQTLREELKGMTATAKKRKIRLKERKDKRKNKNKPDTYEEEVIEFGSAQTGHIRASDRGGSSEFTQKDNITFGERVERPPEISIRPKLPKNSAINSGDSSMLRKKLKLTDAILSSDSGKASEKDIELTRARAVEAYKALKEKRKQNTK